MLVRLATPADAPRVAVLVSQLGYPSSSDDVARRLCAVGARADHEVLVAVKPTGEVIGCVHVRTTLTLVDEPAVEVASVVVGEGFRSVGVGRALMAGAENWARERGARVVQLRSKVARVGAHSFYERLGYACTKTQKFFRRSLD